MFMNSKKSFQEYIIIWMWIFVLLTLWCFGIFSYSAIKTTSYKQIKNLTLDALNTTNKLLDNEILDYNEKINLLIQDEELIHSLSSKELRPETLKVLKHKLFTLLGTKLDVINVSLVNDNLRISTKNIPTMYDVPRFRHWGVFRYINNQPKHLIYPNNYRIEPGKNNAFSLIKKFKLGDIETYLILDFSQEYLKRLISNIDTHNTSKTKFLITSLQDFVIYNDTDLKDTLFSIRPEKINEYQKEYAILNIDNYSLGIKIYGFTNKNLLDSDIKIFYSTLIKTLIPTFIIGLFITKIISKKMIKPILLLAHKVRNYEIMKNNFEKSRDDEIGEIELSFIELIDKIKEYHLIDIEKREQLRIAELKMLQSQINPHFLYNTLDSIKWKSKLSGQQEIAKMTTALGSLLKASMNHNETVVSLKEELNLIENYIYIQKVRYSDRLEFKLNIDQTILDCAIPKFLLQPLIENAVIHGIEGIENKGLIILNGYSQDKYLFFEIIDNGQGFKTGLDQLLNDDQNKHIGLKNVEKRIKLYYGSEAYLSYDDTYRNGCKMVVRVMKELKCIEY